MRRILLLVLALVPGILQAQEAKPKPMIEQINWSGRLWTVKYPDMLSGITAHGNPSIVGVLNRAYLQTPWEKGEFSFRWAHMPTKNFPTQKEQNSYADHLIVGLRGTGDFWEKRSFELKGSLLLRFRAGSGEIRLEIPPKEKDGEADVLKVLTLPAPIEAGKLHAIKIIDAGNSITVFFDGAKVLEHDCSPAEAGNILVLGNREQNGGMNYSILAEEPKPKE